MVESAPEGADWRPGSLESRLIDAALAHLETVPAEHLSLRKLATEAGVSHQAPYTHFRSRTRFLAAVAGAGLAQVVPEARRSAESAGADPLDRMLALADHHCRFVQQRPHLFDLAFGPLVAMRDHRVLQTAAIAYWTLTREIVGACQPARVSEGELDNRCQIVASTVYGIARIGAHHKIPRSVPASTQELVSTALTTLQTGWAATAGTETEGRKV